MMAVAYFWFTKAFLEIEDVSMSISFPLQQGINNMLNQKGVDLDELKSRNQEDTVNKLRSH